ncbi:hypothetical protein ACM66B_002201 [Microbotryomycetes sp. NB124-2]
MNTIQEIRRINEAELAAGTKGSWHDQYKDSAYINVSGLPFNLTEGDVITIFSQYGEIVDISMPRDPNTQKPRGFAFLMYADQRSTVLAVDNLNGAKVLQRTLKVDHVLNYKQLERDNETGKMKERDAPSMAAHPERFLKDQRRGAARDGEDDGSDSDSSHPSIDPDDPMRDYLIEQKRAARHKKRSRRGPEGEGSSASKEQKRARKEERRRIREERAKRKAIKGTAEADRPRRDRSPVAARDGTDKNRSGGHGRRDDEDRKRDPGYGDRSRDERGNRERRDSDARDRRDRDRDRDDGRDRRERGDDRRGGGGGGSGRRPGISAFADLEAWATSK